jgi:hypothetical protein
MAKYLSWWAIVISLGKIVCVDNPALSEDAIVDKKFR